MRRLLAASLLVLLSAASALAAEPPKICTQMWCDEGFTLKIDSPQWPAGEYKIEMTVDGQQDITCMAKLPLPPCDQAAYVCQGGDVMVTTEGCALDAAAQKISGLRMKSIPHSLSAKVTRPDGMIRDINTAVTPQCSYPNGELCDKAQCCSAALTLSFN